MADRTEKDATPLETRVEKAVRDWENQTRQSLGPMIPTEAYNALDACLRKLPPLITAALRSAQQ